MRLLSYAVRVEKAMTDFMNTVRHKQKHSRKIRTRNRKGKVVYRDIIIPLHERKLILKNVSFNYGLDYEHMLTIARLNENRFFYES